MAFDIFISYKRKSLATANNLYYRLTTRGYSTFYDLEEMGRDNFNTQILEYIDNAKDVFVILEEGSLDACKDGTWQQDWFCREIAYAIKKEKNIIPILLGGYKMPDESFFPNEMKSLSLKQAPEFSFSFFGTYIDRLIEKKFLISVPNKQDKATSVFKFYSNENCQVFKDGKLVCSLDGMSDEPYYLPVNRKGDYRFKAINLVTGEGQTLKEHIDANEEKEIDINWESRLPLKPEQEWPMQPAISGDNYLVDLGYVKFNMVRVEGGELMIGATENQKADAETNEHPAHLVKLPTFYIAQFPITQNIWEIVMGYNKSHFSEKEKQLAENLSKQSLLTESKSASHLWPSFHTTVSSSKRSDHSFVFMWSASPPKDKGQEWLDKINKFINPESSEIGHYPAESLSHDEAIEFVNRLSLMTNIPFSLPTEEEWEYAARGGKKSKGSIYAGSDNIDEVAWYQLNADNSTHPVGMKLPNELGLFDMCGNVWEWTETPAHIYGMDVVPGSSVFIRRGGSWAHPDKNCRVSRRYASDHSKKTSGLGLRVVIRKNIK